MICVIVLCVVMFCFVCVMFCYVSVVLCYASVCYGRIVDVSYYFGMLCDVEWCDDTGLWIGWYGV